MNIMMAGVGHVGLVTGACFAKFGHHVMCVDADREKVDKMIDGVMPVFEPGLDELVKKNVAEGRLRFSTDLSKSVPHADAIFMSVGTSTSQGGNQYADLKYVQTCARDVAIHLDSSKYVVVVDKGIIPGGERQVARIIREKNSLANFDMASDPEFLCEGYAIEDFTHRDSVMIGVETDRAGTVLQDVYRPFAMDISLMRIHL